MFWKKFWPKQQAVPQEPRNAEPAQRPPSQSTVKASLLSLESRLMFDAAAAATAAEVNQEQVAQEQAESAVSDDNTSGSESQASLESQELLQAIANYLPGETSTEVAFVDPTVQDDQSLLTGGQVGQDVTVLPSQLTGTDVTVGIDSTGSDDESALVAPTTAGSADRTEVIFVDGNVTDYELLVSRIQAQSAHVEVIVLDAQMDGVQAITAALSRYEPGTVDAVHILSHGVEGGIQVGSTWINQFSLQWQADIIASWGQALTTSADIMLWGCNVASTTEGQTFVDRLAEVTGADVAASTDATGHALVGGDWQLEYATEQIETQEFTDSELSDWVDVLAISANGTATSSQATAVTSLTWSHTVASGSNRALFVTLAIDGLGAGVNSVTYGGVALTQVGRTTGNHAVEIWRLVNPTVGTGNIVVSLGATTDIKGGAVTYNGVDQTTPTGTYVGATGTGTTASVNVSSTTGSLVLDITNWDNNPSGYTTGSGQSDVWNLTNTGHRGISTTEAGAATVTMSSTVSASNQWEIGAVSINASVNVAPTITGLSGDSLNYSKGDGAVVIEQGGNAVVADSDSANFDTGTVTVSFTAGSDSAEDVLSIHNQGTGAGQIGVSSNTISYGGTTIGTFTGGSSGNALVITLNSNATPTAVTALVKNITYQNTDTNAPTNGARTVRFVVTDGDGGTSGNYDTTVTVETGTWRDAATGAVIGGPVGNDWYVGDEANNTPVSSAGGADIMYGAGGDDTLTSGSGNDILVGGTGNDTISGGSDDDVILGGSGNDYLDSGSAVVKNTIIGGGGSDQMIGGSGADVFRFTGAQSGDVYTVNGGGATDIIDLSEFSTATITNSGGVITVDRGGGNVFTINHSNVETIITAATVGNHGPLADAGSDQTVTTSSTVTLTAAGSSDQDGNTLTYQWTQIEGTKVTLSSSTAASPTFTAPSSATTLQFVVVVSDGTTSHADTVVINVGVANSAPTINNLSGDSLSYSEGDGAVVIDQGANALVADSDSANFDTGTLTISIPSGNVPTEDVLSIRDQGTGAGQIGVSGGNVTYGGVVIGTYAGGAGGNNLVVTFNNNATPTAVTALVKNITYEDINVDAPIAGALTIRFSLTDGGGGTSANYDMTVNVSGVNDAPVNVVPGAQSTNEDTTLVFSSGNGNQISITDPDASGGTFEVTISVTNGTLTLAGTTGLTFVTGDGTADTTMIVRGTVTDINNALNGASFTPTGDYSGGATLSITTIDSTLVNLNLDANLQARYTFEGNTNDVAPGTAQNGTLNGNATYVTDGTRGQVLSLDGVGDNVQITGLFGNPANVTLAAWVNLTVADSLGSHVISLGDSVLLTVDEPSGGNGVAGVFYNGTTWVKLTTGQFIAGTGWHHVAYTFDDTNNTNTIYIDGVAVATATASASISYTQGANSFIGQHGNGNTAFDFAGKIDDARVYNRALTAAEIANLANDLSLTDTDSVAITVNAVNDAPVLADTALSMTVGEDAGAPSGAVGSTISAFTGGITEPDGGTTKGIAITGSVETNGTWYYTTDGGTTWTAVGTVSNTSALLLADNANTRLYFAPSANYNGTSTAALTVRAWDQTSGTAGTKVTTASNGGTTAFSSATDTIDVSVTAVNDAPTISYLAGDSQTYAEGAGAVIIENGFDSWVQDVDSSNFDTGSLTVSIPSGGDSAEDVLSIRHQGTAGGQIGVSGSNVTYQGVIIGTFTGGSSGSPLVVTFNSNATVAAVDALVLNITYNNTDTDAPTTGARTVRFALTDGDGGTSLNYDTTVTVSAVNDAPVLADTALSMTVAEDAGAPSGAVGSTISAFTGGITDVDSGAAKGIAITANNETNGTWYYTTNGGTTWTAVGTVSNTSALLLADNANTRLYFAPNADYNGTSSAALTIRAWDQTSGTAGTKVTTASNGGTTTFSSATDTIDVNVTAVNDDPTLIVSGSSTVVAGTTYTLNLSATDPDGVAITSWTINWGDGNIETIAGNPSSVTHVYSSTQAGLTANITVSATDANGTYFGNDLLVPSWAGTDVVYRYDGSSGTLLGTFAGGQDDQVEAVIGPDGNVYVSALGSGEIVKYSATGTVLGTFVTNGTGGLSGPAGLAFGPDGHLYVSDYNTGNVLRFDGTTGAFVDVFVNGATNGMSGTLGITFGPDGQLYVADRGTNSVQRFDSITGVRDVSFDFTNAPGGLEDIAFGPDGQLYAADLSLGVLRYSAVDGTFLGTFVAIGSGGLSSPTGITFGPDGHLYVSDQLGAGAIRRYDGGTGAYIDNYASGGGLVNPTYLNFAPDEQVLIVAANAAPTMTNLGGDSLSYNEGDGAVVIEQGGNATVADSDSANFDTGTLTVSFTAGSDSAEDVLSIRNQGTGAGQIGVSGSTITYSGTTIGTFTGGSSGTNLVITLNSNSTPTAVTALVKNITYQNTDTDAPTTGARTVRLVLTDGDGGTSSDYDTTVTVSAVNDAPTIGGGFVPAIAEDTTNPPGATISSMIGGSFSDPDTGASLAGILITHNPENVTQGTWQYSTDGGANWYDVGTIAYPTSLALAAAASIRFVPAADYVGSPDVLSFRGLDDTYGSGFTNGATKVTADASSPGGTSPISSSLVSFGTTITAVNDAPVNTVPGAQTVNEDTLLSINGLSVTDVDGNLSTVQLAVVNGTLSVTLSGTASVSAGVNGSNTLTLAGSQADINATLATLTYQGTANFNGSDTLTMTSTDTNSGTDVDTVAITVTALNDAPTFSSLDGTPTYLEGGSSVVLDADVQIVDAELSTLDNFSGATLGLARNGGAHGEDQLAFDGIVVTTSGANVFVSGVQVGTYTFTGGQLDILFNASATQARVNTLMQHIVYWNSSDTPPGSVQINWTFTDGNNSAQGGGGALQATGSTTVTITAVDDAPVATGGSVVGTEDTVHVFTWAEFNVTDSDSSTTDETAIQIIGLSVDGVLEVSNGFSWEPVTELQTITKATIDAGWLRFRPDVNESGQDAYPTAGVGDLRQDYAQVLYRPVQTIAITNPDAELGITYAEGTGNNVAAGWVTSGTVYTSNVTAGEYADDHDQLFTLRQGAQISQVLSTNFSTTLDYELTVDVGWHPAWLSPSFQVELWAGGTLVGVVDQSSITPVIGEFVRATLVVDGSAFGAADGQPLEIRLSESSGFSNVVQFDNVMLTTLPGGIGSTVTLTIDITPQNDAPVITPIAPDVTFVEGGVAQVIDATGTITDVDSTNLDGGVMTVSISANGTGDDRLQVGNFGTDPGQVGVSGSNVTYGGTVIGTVSGGTSGSDPLVITFNTNATPSAVQEVYRSIQFNNVSENPSTATRTLTIGLTDGDGGTATSQTKLVYVQAVNDASVLTFGEGDKNFTEGALAVMIDALPTVSDLDSTNFDAGTLTITISANPSVDDRVELLNTGMGAGQIGVSGTNVYYGGTLIGTQAGGIGAVPFVVTFNTNADAAIVGEVMANIRFWVAGDSPSTATRTVEAVLTDGDGGTSLTASKQITVTAVNDPTVVSGGTSGSGNEDTTITGTLTATDNDGLSDGTVFSVSANATNGTASIDPATGLWSYQPNADWNGSDTFTVTITDDAGNTTTQVITVTVTPVVDITNDSLTTNEDAAISANVLTGTNGATADSFEGTPVLTGVTQGVNGTVTFLANGTVTYTPNANFNGTDSFTYTITSGGVTETATVTVTVNAVDDPTVVTGGTSGTGNEDTTLTGTLTASDNDGLSDGTVFTVTGAATNGTASINPATGLWSYTPNADYNGSDSFTVTITDDAGNSTTQVISVTVSPVADIVGDTATTSEDTALVLAASSLLTNDTFEGTPVVTNVGNAVNGTVSLVAGVITFSPTANYTGSASFDYTVTSGGVIETATVTVTVTAVDDPTVVTGGTSGSGNEDTTITGLLTATDNDGLSDGTVFTVSANATNGTASIDPATGLWSYTPNADWNGSDSFTVTITDDVGNTATQVISVTVSPVNDAPTVVVNTGSAVAEGGTDTITSSELAVSDVEETAAQLTYSIGTGPTYGRLELTTAPGVPATTFTQADIASGRLIYLHNGSEASSDSFTFTVSDGAGGTLAPTTVTLTITPVNDTPTITSNGGASTAAINVAENVSAVTIVTGSDVDLPAQALTYSISGGMDQALFTINAATGALDFVVPPDFEVATDANGDNVYIVQVQVVDSQGASTTQTIQVTVTDVAEGGSITPTSLTVPPILLSPTPPPPTGGPSSGAGMPPGAPIPGDRGAAPAPVSPGPASMPPVDVRPIVQGPLTLAPPSDRPVAKIPDEVKHTLPTPAPDKPIFFVNDEQGRPLFSVLPVEPTSTLEPEPPEPKPSVSDLLLTKLDEMAVSLERAMNVSQEHRELVARITAVTGTTLSVGFVAWALRSGTILASLLATMPAWQHFDPLPVVKLSREERKRRRDEVTRAGEQEAKEFTGLDRVLDEKSPLKRTA